MRGIRAGIKRFLRKIGHFFTHWSVKKVIGLAAVVALCAAGVLFVPKWLGKNTAVDAMVHTSTRTTLLEKSSLTESVTVTGTVESNAVANVTSSANYKITDVLVKAGDSVMEGQVLCLLDTTDLQEEITKAKKNLADGVTTAQRSYNDAVETRDEALEKALKGEVTLADAQTALNNETVPYNTAKNSISEYQRIYKEAYDAEEAAGTQVNNRRLVEKQQQLETAQNAVTTAQAAYDAANAAWVTAGSVVGSAEETAKLAAEAALKTAKVQYETAQTDLANVTEEQATILNDYNTKVTALKTAEANLNTAKLNSNFQTFEATYNAAVAAKDAARKSLDQLESTYKSTLKTVTSAEEALKKAKTSDALETLQKQLEETQITATASGTITAVNATVGSMAAGSATSGPLFAIQDTTHLKVAVTIDEYDIKNIQTGQKVVILSDATGEKEISGTVSQISLTATTTQTATGFGAEITVNDTSSGLLIGMSAKAKIIINEKTNVYSAPYDAVGTDETGATVVYAKQPDGTFQAVPVTVGMETDYYVEISGLGLAEGMEIRSSADESSIDNTSGMMGGDMQMMGGNMSVTAAPAPAMGGGGPGGRG